FDKAWNMAKKDNFLQPFAEHHGLLQGLIESQLKRSEPELYKKIIDITGQFSNGWRKLHNTSTNETIADGLTTTEFSIAMLVNKKWTISRIAAHLQFSERTVKNYIACIYQKLGIKNRSDLKKHMLK
ncbi:MAG: LuxR C-terminal-related transcriptional regulator, partial [Oscillospiraceae bacterium]